MKIKLHELPKLGSCRFTYENSASRARQYPPATIKQTTGELEMTTLSPYTPIGWTDQPPFRAMWDDGREDVIAIMFEDREFNLIWCHYVNPLPALIAALTNENSVVCEKAAESLGKIGDPASVPALTVALSDKDDEVRQYVTEALDEIGVKYKEQET